LLLLPILQTSGVDADRGPRVDEDAEVTRG